MIFTRKGILLLTLTLATILLLTMVATLLFMQSVGPPPPPLVYSAGRYPAYNPVLCAGDVLRWPVVLTVDAAPDRPAISAIIRTVWSADQQRTVLLDPEPEYVIHMEHSVISTTSTYTVPLTLPPGNYEVRTGRLTEARDVRGYAVSFVVRDCDG